jgi:hypothetical protein
MKSLLRFFVFLAALAAATSTSLLGATVGEAVAAIQKERIQSSYLIAFGRLASDDEVKYWSKQNPKSVGDLVTNHRDFLKRDTGTHQDVIRRSYKAALGTTPDANAIKHWMGGNDTFTMLVNNHVEWLRGNPDEYTKVIKRSYKNVLGREANDGEVK